MTKKKYIINLEAERIKRSASPRGDKMMLITHLHDNNAINAFDLIFKLGYRAGKKEGRKIAKREN